MKRIVSDILKNKDVDTNLKKYSEGIKRLYNKYSVVRLALNYYTYYQIQIDDDTKRDGYEEMTGEIHRIIRDSVLSDDASVAESIKRLDDDRNVLLNEVSALTYYVDVFKIYEHALNRVEYRFKEQKFPEGYSDEQICRMLMQYILSDEDNVVINSKISEVIAELPIRMTKAKFFEHVSNGLSIYKGSDKKTLDDFLYMIKTSAMILKEDGFAQSFPELEDTLNDFASTDFTSITEEEYKDLARSMEDVSAYIQDVMNVSMMLMEIINDVYSILLTKKQAEEDKVTKACNEIVAAVNDYFILGSEVEEEIEDMFVMLEGSQESLYSKINMYDILDEIHKSYDSEIKKENLAETFEDLDKLSLLCSDSIFVELKKDNDDTVVDDDILENEKNKLIEEFKTLFADNGKHINRAIMASVLSELPVFFNNISELQDFIYQTLYNCSDVAEKIACIEVLHQIMEE